MENLSFNEKMEIMDALHLSLDYQKRLLKSCSDNDYICDYLNKKVRDIERVMLKFSDNQTLIDRDY